MSSSLSNLPKGKKLIAVMGATGLQGGAVVKAIHELEGDEFEIRAITRDPTSDKAKAIEPLVKEVVKANGDDEASMIEAFKGCYGAFIVTNFWEDMNMTHEMKTTRTIQAAASKSGLKHVVLSSLPDTREFVSKAKNKDTWKVLDEETGSYVPHFDGKGAVSKEFLESDIPTTSLDTCMYIDNFINFGMGPKQHAPGTPHAITFPMADAKLPLVLVKDIGRAAVGCFKDPASTLNKRIGISGDILTCAEIASTFEKVCGYTVVYNAVPTEVYAGFEFPGAADLANMFRYKKENEEEFCGSRTVEATEALIGAPTIKLEEWITENKGAFAIQEEKAN